MSTSLEFLESYIIKSVDLALRKYGKNDPFVTADKITANLGGMPGHVSAMLFWSGIAAVALKIHFEVSTAKKLAGQFLNMASDEVVNRVAMDFMKELTNVIGGELRRDFSKSKISVSMSLPFLTRPDSETGGKEIHDPRMTVRQWTISNSEGILNISAEICLIEPHVIEAIREEMQKTMDSKNSGNDDDSGGLDFL